MKFGQLILVIVISAAVAFGVAYVAGGHRGDGLGQSAKETRLEQVKRTGILRCGYGVFPPFVTKDPNTGKIGGIVYDLVEEMGRQLKLKIEWTTEIAHDSMLTDLALNRYDMVCLGLFQTPGRAREGDFTMPLLYAPVNLYVRKDDTRFDQDFTLANDPAVRIATLDGEYSSIAADEFFPKAVKVAVPQLASSMDFMLAVATNKADVVVTEGYTFATYDASNPGVLRAAGVKPLSVLAMSLPIPANEPAFKATLNTTMAYLHDSGFIDRLLKKYEGPVKNLRVAKPYQEDAK